MSDGIQFQAIGGAELDKALRDLRAQMGGKEGNLVKNALSYVSRNSIKKDIVAAAPVSKEGTSIDWGYAGGKYKIVGPKKAPPGRLQRAISSVVHRNPHLSELVGTGVFAKSLGNSRNDPDGAWYAHIVEHRTGFMRNAFKHNAEKYSREVSRQLATGIQRVARKIGDENSRAVAAKVKMNATQSLLAWRPSGT